jgi:hypothetical protein
LETWEPLFENKQITHVSFQSIESGEEKGEIHRASAFRFSILFL